ncbi:RNA-directed DNA polymerase, eukaryota, reverse transcriptase zinc-binding domain protein [Tanacetum coccineum]
MIREIEEDEINEAMFQIDGNKAPGPDGFSSYFFKRAWNIVGSDVCNAIKEFFITGKMLKKINSTIISLIPKIQTPDKATDFRHIACCIFQDNILLSQELFKGYERKEGPKRVAMKVDIQKAYDTVNWKFLEAILKGFSFHDRMVHWIMSCVTTVAFSLCVNGESWLFQRGKGFKARTSYISLPFHIGRKAHLLEDKQIPSVGVFDEVYFAFGRHLEEIHATWADLEKKRTRLQTYTKSMKKYCLQNIETASQA